MSKYAKHEQIFAATSYRYFLKIILHISYNKKIVLNIFFQLFFNKKENNKEFDDIRRLKEPDFC